MFLFTCMHSHMCRWKLGFLKLCLLASGIISSSVIFHLAANLAAMMSSTDTDNNKLQTTTQSSIHEAVLWMKSSMHEISYKTHTRSKTSHRNSKVDKKLWPKASISCAERVFQTDSPPLQTSLGSTKPPCFSPAVCQRIHHLEMNTLQRKVSISSWLMLHTLRNAT